MLWLFLHKEKIIFSRKGRFVGKFIWLYMELLKISFRQPEVVLALAKMVHDVHEKQNVPNPL